MEQVEDHLRKQRKTDRSIMALGGFALALLQVGLHLVPESRPAEEVTAVTKSTGKLDHLADQVAQMNLSITQELATLRGDLKVLEESNKQNDRRDRELDSLQTRMEELELRGSQRNG